jgi:hypothetical protein
LLKTYIVLASGGIFKPRNMNHHYPPLGLTDYQLKIVMGAARLVPVEKRDTFLQRMSVNVRFWG